MLPRKNRVDKKAVDQIFKKGSFLNSPNLTFKFILGGKPGAPRISFIAPKSVAKLAVKRNLLRRRGYRVLHKYIRDFPTGITGVFIFKTFQDDLLIIENEVKNILNKMR